MAQSSGVVSFLVVETQKPNGDRLRNSDQRWERTDGLGCSPTTLSSLPCLFASLLMSGERRRRARTTSSAEPLHRVIIQRGRQLPGLPSWMENDGAKTTNTTRPQRPLSLLPYLLAAHRLRSLGPAVNCNHRGPRGSLLSVSSFHPDGESKEGPVGYEAPTVEV